MKHIVVPAPRQLGGKDVTFAEYVSPLLNDQRFMAPLKHQRLAARIDEALWVDPLADSPVAKQQAGDVWALEDLAHELLLATMNEPHGITFFPGRRRLIAFGEAIEKATDEPPLVAVDKTA